MKNSKRTLRLSTLSALFILLVANGFLSSNAHAVIGRIQAPPKMAPFVPKAPVNSNRTGLSPASRGIPHKKNATSSLLNNSSSASKLSNDRSARQSELNALGNRGLVGGRANNFGSQVKTSATQNSYQKANQADSESQRAQQGAESRAKQRRIQEQLDANQ